MSGIILPGGNASGIPVDPNDPTKGVLNPVLNGQQLTEAVTQLATAVRYLMEGQQALHAMLQDGFVDIGDLLEALISDLKLDLDYIPGPSVTEFLEARAEARRQAEEENYAPTVTQEEVAAELGLAE